MIFKNRKQAGQKLAEALEAYKNCDGIVLAIPCGGAEVGYYIAEHLELPLSVVIVRKLPFPENPEAGFGAIAEDGSTFFITRFKGLLSKFTIDEILNKQKQEIKRRIEILREGKPLPQIAGKTVIEVDDGKAMGSTMRAAIMLCRNQKAGQIIAAAPVAGPDAAAEMARAADKAVILEKPLFFRAVAESYKYWYDVPYEEVVTILKNFEMNSKTGNK